MTDGTQLTGSIDDTNTFAGYCFDGVAGQEVTIDVEATSGDLDTNIGLFDAFSEITYATNDDISDKNTDSQIIIELEDTGTYLIFVSRFDLDEGTTSGTFQLTLTIDGAGNGGGSKSGGAKSDPDDTITITCDTGEILYGGMQFGFINVNPGFPYTITLFGLDGLDPVLAVETSPGIGGCNDDESLAAGSFVSIPGEGTLRANRQTAQIRFNLNRASSPVLTVGSFDGNGGTFVMVIEGLAISPSTEADGFVIRVPSSVVEDPLSVYMISRYADLDPYLQVAAGEGLDEAFDDNGDFDPAFIDYNNAFILAECDDAGLGDCRDTPAMPGGGVDIANGSTYITGDVDAGLQFLPDSTEPFLYIFSSTNGRTAGTYAIVIIGSVPSVDIQ